MKMTIWKPSPAQIAEASTETSAWCGRAQERLRRQADMGQHVVDEADRHRLVEPAPHPGQRRGGGQEGQEIERTDEAVHEAHLLQLVGDDEGDAAG